MRMIKCFDTLQNKYINVEVSEELETYIKRSYWREDMQDRRFQARKQLYNEEVSYESTEDPVFEDILKAVEIMSLRNQIDKLDERSKLIVFYRYYEDYTISKIANKLGISNSYVTKLLKKIHNQIKSDLENSESKI